jgi:hypothetical protein
MLCDVCNAMVADGEGHRISPDTFRQLLDAGFGIGPVNLDMLTSAGMPRDEAMARLRQAYRVSETDWLLCPKCASGARNALRQNTKYNLGPGHFQVHDFPPQLAVCNGLVPIPVIIDLIVGEEIGLYWLDRTPFIQKLASIRPFRLMLKTGVYRSAYGPLMWLLFYVPNPQPEPQPFASVECHINPSEVSQVNMWHRVANQTHWHLTLLGADNEVADSFEFENDFGLDTSLPMMTQACQGLPVTDFMRAKGEFWKTYTMDDLYRMRATQQGIMS